ncbi:MAG: type II secretion system F family protein [Acidobacteria bacterium]|nr:type II secretion system F family protein [Acidobacteriota bacterium]
MAFVVLVFLSTFGFGLLAVWLARTLIERSSAQEEEAEPQSPAFAYDDAGDPLLLREAEISSISIWARVLERLNVTQRMKDTLSQADLGWSVGRLTLAMLFISAMVAALLNKISWLPFWALLALAGLAGLTPYFHIRKRRNRRLLLIEEQMPEALESMARALRAGHPFAAALDTVAGQTPHPLGREMRKTFAEGALGMPWAQALENLAKRVSVQEIALFTTAVQVQSRAGGNLSEVLDKLAESMREAEAIKGEVRSLSAQGRFAGRILTALPIAIAGILLYVNPTFLLPLITDPVGKILLISSGLGIIASHLIIRKLVDIHL